MARMTDDELLAHVEREEANSLVHFNGLLQEQRRKAMQYYYGEPYGNEVEGRSQVVTTEVKDAVETVLPSLMEMFARSGQIVRCEPNKPEDEAAAAQATDYLNYIFWEKNPGFLILDCLFKDALLQKNGYCKVYWEDYEDCGREEYEGLNDLEFQSLVNDPELDLKQHTEYPDPQAGQMIQQAIAQGAPPNMIPPVPNLHDAVFKRTRKYGKTCIEPCPPEEVIVQRETPNDLSKAYFIEHRTLKTISEIREMGYDIPDDIADYAPNADFNLERTERMKFDDALAYRQDNDTNDPSGKRVWYCEAYCKVDYDGDGIAELRQVCKVGKTLLANEEIDSIPIIGGTAILMPHKHYGLSIHDLIGDIQLQKSMVLRQLFDNAYVANNGRLEVLDNMVNMADLLTARPNGIIRVKAMGSVKRLDNPLLGAEFYNLLEYMDKLKQSRVGATDFPSDVDPDAINAKAAFVDAFKEGASQRKAHMARILAETVVKPLFWKILELESKHQQKPQMVKLRGKFVQVDPREWANKFSMTINVGLGTGSQQTTLNGAMAILQVQQQAAMAGLTNVVTPSNLYNAMHQLALATFPKNADLMFTDPSTLPPPQPKPDPKLLDLQLKDKKLMMGDQLKRDKMAQDAQSNFMDVLLELKRMGIDVLQIWNDRQQNAADRMHEHVQNMVTHGVDLAKHKMDIENAPAPVQ